MSRFAINIVLSSKIVENFLYQLLLNYPHIINVVHHTTMRNERSKIITDIKNEFGTQQLATSCRVHAR